MSKLYEELRDLAVKDETVHAHLKHQSMTDSDDLTVAIELIRQLAEQKKAYFDMATKSSELSIDPVVFIQASGEVDAMPISEHHEKLDTFLHKERGDPETSLSARLIVVGSLIVLAALLYLFTEAL